MTYVPSPDGGGSLPDVMFAPDSPTLAGAAGPILVTEARRLEQRVAGTPNPPYIVIAGHTAATSTPAANVTFSQERAEHVLASLVADGVPKALLSVVGCGQQYPVASDETATGRTLNRRVVIRIFATPPSKAEACA
jgi:outer membrane protein OmpA-like peptidoglycan-associated protein